MAKFNKMNAIVIGISIDLPFSNKVFKEQYKLNFIVVSDYNREIVKKYNVYWKFSALLGYILAKRSVFVKDRGGDKVQVGI